MNNRFLKENIHFTKQYQINFKTLLERIANFVKKINKLKNLDKFINTVEPVIVLESTYTLKSQRKTEFEQFVVPITPGVVCDAAKINQFAVEA